MHGARIGDDAIVRLRGIEILLERIVLLLLHEGIVRTVQDEDLGLDGSRSRSRGVEAERGVETGNGFEVVAGARHVQYDRAAEAVADGAEALRIDRVLFGELGLCRLEARFHRLRVLHDRARESARVLRVVGGLGIAVHVGNEGRVALLGELLRLVMDVRGDAPPFVDHHDSRLLGLDGVVVHHEALHRRRAVRIGDGLLLDLGVCGRGHRDHAKCAQHYRSHSDLPAQSGCAYLSSGRKAYNSRWSDARRGTVTIAVWALFVLCHLPNSWRYVLNRPRSADLASRTRMPGCLSKRTS